MNKADFVGMYSKIEINENAKKIAEVYKTELPNDLIRVLSCMGDTVFFDDEGRLMALIELESISNEYNVNFIEEKMVPVIDCYDGTFIVYDLKNQVWAKYNCFDKLAFRKKDDLKDLLV